jgi:hypothetical protein
MSALRRAALTVLAVVLLMTGIVGLGIAWEHSGAATLITHGTVQPLSRPDQALFRRKLIARSNPGRVSEDLRPVWSNLSDLRHTATVEVLAIVLVVAVDVGVRRVKRNRRRRAHA